MRILLLTFLSVALWQSGLVWSKVTKALPAQDYVQALTSDFLWLRRINATISLIENNPCQIFQEEANCTLQFDSSRLSNMTLYTAERKVDGEKLKTVLPDKSLGREKAHDAVIVIDLFPEANFGHNVLLFFVYYDKETFCLKRHGFFTAFGECIIPAHKKHCQNMIHRRRKRKCNIDFLPLVHVEGDESKKQRLECQSNFAGFGACPDFIHRKVGPPLKCENAPRGCSSRPKDPIKQYCFFFNCDYAVLLSGSWSSLTGRTRAEKNIKTMWDYFVSNGYKKENIEIFYGNDGAIEVDGDPETKDARPASREFGVRKHIHDLCLSWNCVDTLTIYLNNPTRSNGAMLLWDNNGDGTVEDSETYSVREIFYDLVGCGAKRVFIIADQSFSEYLVDKLRQLNKNGDSEGDWYKKISIFASSEFTEPSWGTEFTDAWVKASESTKCMGDIFQGAKTALKTNNPSHPLMVHGNPAHSQLTVYGGSCSETGSSGMGCKSFPPGSWKLPPRRRKDGGPRQTRQWPEQEEEEE